MEAATAGAPAGAEAGQVDGGQVEAGEQTQAPEVDISSFDARLSEAADSIRELAQNQQTLLSRIPEPQAEAAPDFDAQYQELFEASGGYPDPAQLQQLNQQAIEHGVQQAVAPFVQQMQAFQQQMTAQELSGLQSEFPELASQDAADQLADAVVNSAASMLPQGAPPEIAEGLMQNANFVRLVHLAEKARGRIQQETPAGQGQTIPQVETGGGAAPQTTAEGDEWDKIANAGRPNGGRIW